MDEGHGFLRLHHTWLPGPEDVYVPQRLIRSGGLRTGNLVLGQARPGGQAGRAGGGRRGRHHRGRGGHAPRLFSVSGVNGLDPALQRERPVFETLTPIFPDRPFDLELPPAGAGRAPSPGALSNRVIGMFAPIGKGQRGLVVAPPKAGKTTVLRGIADAVACNHPGCLLLVALIGERPEEVTDWQRTVTSAEVISSTFDEPPESMTRRRRCAWSGPSGWWSRGGTW